MYLDRTGSANGIRGSGLAFQFLVFGLRESGVLARAQNPDMWKELDSNAVQEYLAHKKTPTLLGPP